ncbi:DUF3995 domain-containing protein [Flagellimonas sediminis]|uniref:DUF3995 domain-containing protein n=1 Tax=Flagellimonas sediminis TaxID=2696468 RepID=A0A6I5L6D4_9FLAO|nr:DUF3995 domain-containing protein [Allomuricauda sediminis]NDV44390.1 DUF3995 domain-containing protein [Allomuricauda sediminis]
MGTIALLLSIIFIFLAGLHFYWALFGIKDSSVVLPTKENGKFLFKPGKLGIVLVGLFLSLFAWVYLNKAINFTNEKEHSFISVTIGMVFFLRAIGDFKYLGFFKKIKSTKFAEMDSRYYVPLALLITLLIFVIELWP